MIAVIKTGGKQYLVSPGQKIKIEKINKKEGELIDFTDVLLIARNENEVKIGQPIIKGATVKGKVTKQGKDKKIIIFKYRPKKRYRKKQGFRPLYTEVEITDIQF